jgi:hypothetical protein
LVKEIWWEGRGREGRRGKREDEGSEKMCFKNG